MASIEHKGQSPSCDYFKVKNDWWDALTSYEGIPPKIRCLNFIIRKTYGWQKKECPISLKEFSDATKITESNVARILKRLKTEKLINAVKKKGSRQTIYSFNKYYENWEGFKTITNDSFDKSETIPNDNLKLSKEIVSSNRNDSFDKVVPIIVKDNIKDNIKTRRKSEKTIYDKTSFPYFLSKFLIDQITINLPNFKPANNGNVEKTIQRWAIDIDKMIRLDKRDPNDIKKMISWCQNDDFWFSNILSGAKLRKQYDALSAARIQKQRKIKNEATSNEDRFDFIK